MTATRRSSVSAAPDEPRIEGFDDTGHTRLRQGAGRGPWPVRHPSGWALDSRPDLRDHRDEAGSGCGGPHLRAIRPRRRWTPIPSTGASPMPPGRTNPAFFALRETYLACVPAGRGRRGRSGRAMPSLDAKALLAWQLLADALAPTNFLLTNPAALRRASETGGWSLVKGADQLPRRPGDQRRQTSPGRHQLLRGGQEPRCDPGQGRVPQRPDGADPVLAPDRDRSMPSRCWPSHPGSTSTT